MGSPDVVAINVLLILSKNDNYILTNTMPWARYRSCMTPSNLFARCPFLFSLTFSGFLTVMCPIVTDGLVAVLLTRLTLRQGSAIMLVTATLPDDLLVPAVHRVLPLALPSHCVEVVPFPVLL